MTNKNKIEHNVFNTLLQHKEKKAECIEFGFAVVSIVYVFIFILLWPIKLHIVFYFHLLLIVFFFLGSDYIFFARWFLRPGYVIPVSIDSPRTFSFVSQCRCSSLLSLSLSAVPNGIEVHGPSGGRRKWWAAVRGDVTSRGVLPVCQVSLVFSRC